MTECLCPFLVMDTVKSTSFLYTVFPLSLRNWEPLPLPTLSSVWRESQLKSQNDTSKSLAISSRLGQRFDPTADRAGRLDSSLVLGPFKSEPSKQRIILKGICWPKLWGLRTNVKYVKYDRYDLFVWEVFIFVAFVTEVDRRHCLSFRFLYLWGFHLVFYLTKAKFSTV